MRLRRAAGAVGLRARLLEPAVDTRLERVGAAEQRPNRGLVDQQFGDARVELFQRQRGIDTECGRCRIWTKPLAVPQFASPRRADAGTKWSGRQRRARARRPARRNRSGSGSGCRSGTRGRCRCHCGVAAARSARRRARRRHRACAAPVRRGVARDGAMSSMSALSRASSGARRRRVATQPPQCTPQIAVGALRTNRRFGAQ